MIFWVLQVKWVKGSQHGKSLIPTVSNFPFKNYLGAFKIPASASHPYGLN